MMKKVLKVSSINEIKKLVDGGDWPESANSRDREILVKEDFQVYRGTMTEAAAPAVGKGGSRQRSAANRTHIDKQLFNESSLLKRVQKPSGQHHQGRESRINSDISHFPLSPSPRPRNGMGLIRRPHTKRLRGSQSRGKSSPSSSEDDNPYNPREQNRQDT